MVEYYTLREIDRAPAYGLLTFRTTLQEKIVSLKY